MKLRGQNLTAVFNFLGYKFVRMDVAKQKGTYFMLNTFRKYRVLNHLHFVFVLAHFFQAPR